MDILLTSQRLPFVVLHIVQCVYLKTRKFLNEARGTDPSTGARHRYSPPVSWGAWYITRALGMTRCTVPMGSRSASYVSFWLIKFITVTATMWARWVKCWHVPHVAKTTDIGTQTEDKAALPLPDSPIAVSLSTENIASRDTRSIASIPHTELLASSDEYAMA